MVRLYKSSLIELENTAIAKASNGGRLLQRADVDEGFGPYDPERKFRDRQSSEVVCDENWNCVDAPAPTTN
jgi:hypothetical protein